MSEQEESPDGVLDGVIEVHRADQAYALQRKGLSLSKIAEELNYSGASAVSRSLSERYSQQAKAITSLEREAILNLELDRLDELQAAHYESATYGDLKATDEVLKIMTLRMKLLKLDVPDASTDKNMILVIGGQEADYVAKLKELS